MNKLSLIMPALNEEENISQAIKDVLDAFDSFKINGEVLAINDGSTDRTQALIEQKIKENPSRVRLIRHEVPKGYGACFWEGVEQASGEFIVVFPSDNEMDPREPLQYYKLLEQVDMVVPFVFNKEVRPFFRNFLSLIFRVIINSTFAVNFNYTNGTALYRKSILKEIKTHSEGFFFLTDIIVRSAKKGYLFAEVPCKLGQRKKGESKAISFPSFFLVVRDYLRLVKDCYFSNKKDLQGPIAQDSVTAIRRKA